jgi:hypothetical protein
VDSVCLLHQLYLKVPPRGFDAELDTPSMSFPLLAYGNEYEPCLLISLSSNELSGHPWIRVQFKSIEPDIQGSIQSFPRLTPQHLISSSCALNPSIQLHNEIVKHGYTVRPSGSQSPLQVLQQVEGNIDSCILLFNSRNQLT